MKSEVSTFAKLPATAADNGADFSPCRTWRYSLWRHWDFKGFENVAMFIGLNPSTADETKNDPTIRRCIGFAKYWGFGGLIMMNLYAFRATDPKAMKAAADPVGPDTDAAFDYYRTRAGLIVAAWGAHAEQPRATAVCQIIGRRIHALGSTKSGAPRHPLYLPAKTLPELYWKPSE